MTKKEKRIIELMQKLNIIQCCLSTERLVEICEGNKKKPVLIKELMIQVENLDQKGNVFNNSATCFLSARRFPWGKNRKAILELSKLMGAGTSL